MKRALSLLCLPVFISACGDLLFDGDGDAESDASLGSKASLETRYEAEDFSAQQGCRERSNHAGFTGAGFMDFGGNGTYIQWDEVTAAVDGEHELTFRFANGSGAGRRGALIVNGANVGNVAFNRTGGWRNWGTESVVVNLRRGKNTVRVRANTGSGGPNIDHLVVVGDDAPPAGGAGLLRAHYRGQWSQLPDFSQLRPTEEDVAQTVGVGPYAGSNGFGLVFTGNIDIATPGNHDFELGSDDGSRLFINGRQVVDNDGKHGFRTRTGTVNLDRGLHSLRVEFFEASGGERLRLRYRRGSSSFAEIPASMLSHGDATPDECPEDPAKTQPGVCGCGTPDVDSDRDGAADCDDGCPADANKQAPGDCGCGMAEGTCSGPIITASGENLPREGKDRAFDGDTRTKWLTFADSGWLQYQVGGAPAVYNRYTITSANDAPERDPRDWRLRGSNDGSSWTVLDERAGEVFASRFQSRTFRFMNSTAYRHYRLDVSSNFNPPRANSTQLAELAFGFDAGPVDQCPNDPNKTSPGDCGCGVPEGSCGGGASERIMLPIEVIGEEGKVVRQTLRLTEDQAGRARTLWLQVNNLGYQDKASVRFNNGAWTSLNHRSATLEPQEAARGGMVHGGFGTIRLTVPLDGALRAGDNTLSFRFNFSDGVSIGYRVIALNLRDSRGASLMGASDFEQEDPADWRAPFTDQASINEGEQLWRNAPLVSNYLAQDGNWYSYSLPADVPIRARCADCHAQDGRDLEIFAYSNGSIIERARFHGLSEDEGKKIASYIRSLSARYDNVGRYGRPWNPPYQPGPAIANRPVQEWAAGAGLEAVLDHDTDMLQGMFGKTRNITRADVERYFDSDRMWNTATQPLAIQLPDWKHWLPLIHPKDAFSRNNYYESDKEADPRKGLQALRSYLQSNRGRYTANRLFSELHKFWQHYRQFLAQGSSKKEHWRTTDGDAFTRGLTNGVSREMAATSLAKHLAVKFFEIHHEFDLQGIARDLIDPAEQPRDRQWLGRQYNVFEVPAHFTACFKTGSARCHNFEGQPRETGEYESTAWYQLQQVINPGIASSREVVPVDYNYQPTLILRASQTSGFVEPVRFYYSSNVMYQTRTRVAHFTPNDKEGFNMRTMGPWLFYGTDNRNNFERLPQGEIPGLLNDIQPGLGTMIVTQQIKQFLKEMARPRNALSSWDRRSNNSSGEHRALDPKNLTTSDMPRLDRPFSGELRHYAHKIYWVIPKFIELGVECAVIEDLKDWSSRAWPNVNWNRFSCN